MIWEPVFVFEEMFATCVPANAKKRKKIVPANSPIAATIWPRELAGTLANIVFAHVLGEGRPPFERLVRVFPSPCRPGSEIFILERLYCIKAEFKGEEY